MHSNLSFRSLPGSRLTVEIVILLSVTLARAADYQSAVLSDAPQAYYRLREDTHSSINQNSGSLGALGNATNDLLVFKTGTNLTGVLHPFPGAIVGDGDRSEFFDYTTRTEIPFNAAFNTPNTQPFTVEAWFYPASDQTGTGQAPINNRYTLGANRQGWTFFQRRPDSSYTPGDSGLGWDFRMYNGVGGNSPLDIQSLAPYQVGKWQHVVVVYDPVDANNATLTIYVDGVAANTMTYSGADPAYAPCTGDHDPSEATTGQPALSIGCYNNANTGLNPYFGAVDEFAWYSNKLSAAQILDHYQNGTNANRTLPYDALVKSHNPVVYLRLDEIAPGSDVAVNLGDLRSSGNATNRTGVRHPASGALAGRTDAGAFGYQWRNGGGTTTLMPWTAENNPDAGIPFTFEAWFRPTADRVSPGPSPVNNRLAGSAVNRTGWVIYQRDPNPTYVGAPGVGESAVGWAFRMYGGSGGGSSDVITQVPYNVGDWTHYVVTWEPTSDNSGVSGVPGQWEGTLTAYVNGVGVASNTAAHYKANLAVNDPPDDALPPVDFAVGSYNAASRFGEELEGDIAEVAFYNNYTLTPDQILDHYRNATNAQPATNYETLVFTAGFTGPERVGLPKTYLRFNDPARRPLANSGALGYLADGNLVADPSSPAGTGPRPPAYLGFEASNQALELDGLKQWASLNNPAGLNISGQITLETWIKPGATQGDPARIVSHGPPIPSLFDSTLLTVSGSMLSSNEVFLSIDGNGANYVVGSFDGTNTYSATYPVPGGDLGGGNWIHLVGTYDGAKWNLFRNGTQVASAAAAVGALPVNGGGWAIGSAGSGFPGEFAGGIDEVAIYNTALTPVKVATHYLIGKVGTATITITKSAGDLSVAWPSGTTLQEATSLSSTFSDVPGSPVSPLSVTAGGTKFYRFRL